MSEIATFVALKYRLSECITELKETCNAFPYDITEKWCNRCIDDFEEQFKNDTDFIETFKFSKKSKNINLTNLRDLASLYDRQTWAFCRYSYYLLGRFRISKNLDFCIRCIYQLIKDLEYYKNIDNFVRYRDFLIEELCEYEKKNG